MSKIVELDRSGDKVALEWNPKSLKQRWAAKKAIKTLLKQGVLLYTLKEDGTKGEQITKDNFKAEDEQQVVKHKPFAAG